jgi:Asp-tRNA(Asn)/Glu-tRNA(Gln) amidotransferase A subunit family amidase
LLLLTLAAFPVTYRRAVFLGFKPLVLSGVESIRSGDHLDLRHHSVPIRSTTLTQNLARSLAAAYDSALRQFDVLVMPTPPIKAAKIPGPDAPLEEQIVRGGEMISNTYPFDATGHPAVNVPCAMSEGLPVGMMFVGRMGDDATILRAADAFQRHVFTPPAPPARS